MAAKLNELKQKALDRKAAINGLLEQQRDAKNAYATLLEKQAAGTLAEDEKPKLADAKKAAESFDDRISAQRNLLQLDEQNVLDEQARVDAETAAAPGRGLTLVSKDPEKAGFKTLGDQLVAIAHVAGAASLQGRPGMDIARRLLAGPTGASEGVPGDGGFFVQQDMSQELIRKTFDIGQILQRVKKVSVAGNGLKVNAVAENSRANGSRWGGVQAFWQEEAGTKTASKPGFRQIDLNLKKLTTLCYATDELLQDASALEGVFMEAFSEEMSFKLEDAIINGQGSGMPLGILNSPALVTQAIEGSQTIANTAASLAVNLSKMWGRMHARSQQNAVWLLNQELLNKLYTATLGGTSAVSGIFIAPGRFNETPYATIFGRPVIPVEYAAAEGTPGDILLVDLATYLLIDKGGMQNASSIHVRFTNDETVFRGVYRADGAPTWNSALTPFKGSNTQSPYIALATRS